MRQFLLYRAAPLVAYRLLPILFVAFLALTLFPPTSGYVIRTVADLIRR